MPPREAPDRLHALRLAIPLLGALARSPRLDLAQLAHDRGAEPREVVLHDVVARARAHGLHGGLLADRARDDDEGRVDAAGLQQRERFGSAEARQVVIGDHEVPRTARERRLELGRGLDALGRRLVAGAPQLAQQQLRVVRGVLDEEQAQQRRHYAGAVSAGTRLSRNQ